MKTRRVFVAALLCLAFAGAVQAKEAVLKVAQVADISNLDPHRINDVYSANVVRQVYNGLVQMDDMIRIKGDLAESWENPDAKTWIFHLRKGVKFHNGEELTASDVKFTIERILDQKTASPGAVHVKEIASVEASDPHTVKITTKNPFAPLLSSLSRYELSVLNEKAVKAGGDAYGKNPVGTGPFKFVEWKSGDRVTLAKFADYFQGPAKVDGIVFRAIPEDATRLVELESGAVDIVSNLPPQDFDRMSKNPNVTVVDVQGQSTLYMGINEELKPFDNKLVRQALNYAVDKQAIIDAVFFGKAAASSGPISPSIWGFDETLKPVYPYDPEKAKELLKKAGFPNGFECVILTDPRTERKSVSELVQSYLEAVGVKASIEAIEWGAFLSATAKGAKGMFIMGWTGTGDADGGLFPRFHSSNIGAANRSRTRSAEIDGLLQKGRTTIDEKERKDVYKKLQAMIIDEAPEIFIAVTKNLAATRKNVKGYVMYPSLISPLYGVSIE